MTTEQVTRPRGEPLSTSEIERLNQLAAQIAVDAIRATTKAGSGHPTTAMSSAHLLAVLFARHFRFDPKRPGSLANDRFILSKGHGAPGLYAVMKAAGWIDDAQLLTLRKLGSPLEGHPVPSIPGIDVATGSLGQGLAAGVGMSLLAKREGHPFHVWVLLGDSEMSEGSVWEAVQTAAYYGLASLTAIVDVNRLGQRGETQLGWDIDAYCRRLEAFGWQAIPVYNGHDPAQVDSAYTAARKEPDVPVAVVAKTIKGYGVSELADKDGWHGKPLDSDMADRAIAELGGVRKITITVREPENLEPYADATLAKRDWTADSSYRRPVYAEPTATRRAYGDALAAIGKVRSDLYVLDAEVSNSTYSEIFQRAHPERFVEMFIEEQCMLGAAVGMAALGRTVFCSTFAAFLTRAHDFIRMASIGRVNLRLCGSHAGVSIGEDGPSQMGLEDLSMMSCLYSSTVFSPADANATVRVVELMADLDGISYLRTQRNPTPLIYGTDEDFVVGGAKLLHSAPSPRVVVVATGVTVHEALVASEKLEARGVPTAVIDAYCLKPLGTDVILEALDGAELLLTVEDHRPEGGLGDAVGSAILGAVLSDRQPKLPRLVKLAVYDMPGSGKPEELRDKAGISANSIVDAARRGLYLD